MSCRALRTQAGASVMASRICWMPSVTPGVFARRCRGEGLRGAGEIEQVSVGCIFPARFCCCAPRRFSFALSGDPAADAMAANPAAQPSSGRCVVTIRYAAARTTCARACPRDARAFIAAPAELPRQWAG
jgi:hypothetical protein